MDMHFCPAVMGLPVAANDGPNSRFQSAKAATYRWNGGHSRFDVYRAKRVSLTSTLFGGGDWHWRLTSPSGAILLDCGGYRDEAECLSAVEALRSEAATATGPKL